MTVKKCDRHPSPFEVYHHLAKMRKEITDLLLRNFGYSPAKAEKKLSRQFGGRSYEELSEEEKRIYDRMKEKHLAFEKWFILNERDTIVDCLRDITKEVYLANNITPTCQEELTERRIHQDLAIGYCYRLAQELQYAIETLPVNVNQYTRFGLMIQSEIKLIKAWRKSDNKYKKILGAGSDSASNFCNVNNNGNATASSASLSRGVRPDFEPVVHSTVDSVSACEKGEPVLP